MPYDELQVCEAFILALSELNSLMCTMSVSEGSSQGYSRLLAFRMTYCIEFSELTRHALEEEGRENKREARVCSMQYAELMSYSIMQPENNKTPEERSNKFLCPRC